MGLSWCSCPRWAVTKCQPREPPGARGVTIRRTLGPLAFWSLTTCLWSDRCMSRFPSSSIGTSIATRLELTQSSGSDFTCSIVGVVGDRLKSSETNSELMVFRRLRGARTDSWNQFAIWRPGSNSDRTGCGSGFTIWRPLMGSADWRPPDSRLASAGF